MESIPSPGPARVPQGPCRRYSPGHHVHWIQARKCCEEPGELHELLLSAADVRDDGWVTLYEVDGRLGHRFRAWYHRPDQLRTKLRAHQGLVRWQPRWKLLWLSVPGSAANTLMYLAPDGPSRC